MFFEKLNKQDALSKIDELLKPYLYLDKTKTDSKDMRFKFANIGLGVAPDTVKFLRSLGQECKSWELSTEERLKITDVLVLYSNHLDQHTDASQNPNWMNKLKIHWYLMCFRMPILYSEQPQNL